MHLPKVPPNHTAYGHYLTGSLKENQRQLNLLSFKFEYLFTCMCVELFTCIYDLKCPALQEGMLIFILFKSNAT